ncbi:MAG: hypothetical protein ACE14T_00995 [Syntrophales bacterium]
MVTGIKYCGGCNPLIDRPGLVKKIEKLLPGNCSPVEDLSTKWEIGVLVCGCPIACADRPSIRRMARHWIRVGGATVDLESVHEDEMAGVIVKKILELKKRKID